MGSGVYSSKLDPKVNKLDPKVWGPSVWATMDALVAGYGDHPSEDLRNAALHFFESLAQLLPCPQCRDHYASLLKTKPLQYPGALSNSAQLGEWVRWVKQQVEEHVKRKAIPMLQNQQMGTLRHKNARHLQQRQVPVNRQQHNHNHPPARAHKNKPVARAGHKDVARGSHKDARPMQQLTYQQRQAAQIAANWKGSKEGLKNYIRSEANYRRPCACS